MDSCFICAVSVGVWVLACATLLESGGGIYSNCSNDCSCWVICVQCVRLRVGGVSLKHFKSREY